MTENNGEQGRDRQPPGNPQNNGGTAAPAEKPAVPVQTRAALSIMYAITALKFTGALLTVLFPLQMARVLRVGRFGENYSSLSNADYIKLLAGIGFVTALVFCVVYVVFTVLARLGFNWARISVTVIFGITTLSLAQISAVNFSWFTLPSLVALMNAISGLLAVAGIVLLWQASSNSYYRSMKTYRQRRTQSARYR